MFNSKLAGALAVFAAVAVAPLAIAAVPANASGASLDAAAEAYRAVYPQLSPAAAESAAADQPSRTALYDSIPDDRFGGAWYDPPSNTVHIAATNAETAEAALRRGRTLGLRVETKLVTRSFDELERQAALLRGGAGPLGAAAEGQVGIEVETNRVLVAVPPAQRASLTAGGVPAGVKVIDDPGTGVETDVCDARDNCDTGVRAGARLWRTNVGSEVCSVGFTGRDFSTDTRWTITAGHCSNGFLVNWGTVGETIGPLIATMNSGSVDANPPTSQPPNAALSGASSPAPAAAPTPLAVTKDEVKDKPVEFSDADLAVPESPAFTVLGLTPQTVARPTSPRAFASSLLNGVDENGNFQSGVALDTAPYLVFAGPSLTLRKYNESYQTRFLARTQFSFGTTKGASDDDKSVRLALGFRMTLWDAGDPHSDEDLLTCFADRLKLPAPPTINPQHRPRESRTELRTIRWDMAEDA